MSTLNAAVKEVNNKGNLALMIYAIPNFPDPDTYQKTLDILNNNPHVTIIETTFPVTNQFSEYANKTIQKAHLQAAKFADGQSMLEKLQAFHKPSVCVLYQETFDALGYETVLQKMQGKIDGLLFEWILPDVENYAYSFERYGIELIQCVDPWMTKQEIKKYLSLAIDEPIIYLASATMTGGELFSGEKIDSCVQSIKEYRPKAKIFAGFGIKTAVDINKLSRIKGLDGIIIGTAFLEAMAQGAEQVDTFLGEITPALINTFKT